MEPIKTVDCIIHAKWIIPVDETDTVLTDHALIIHQQKIADILPSNQVSKEYSTDDTVHLTDHVLLPGLINMHTHNPMILLRGLADDLAFMDWLKNHIWPAEGACLDEEFIRDGMMLSCAEMIRSGTTCINEHYFFPTTAADTIEQIGMRATIGLFMMDFPTNYAQNADEYFQKAEHVLNTAKQSNLVNYAFAPHSPYACSDDVLKKLKSLNDEHQLPIHMHMHESKAEVDESIEKYNMRPIKRLNNLGLLNSKFVNVHMTQIIDEDFAIIKDSDSHVVHCPESNLKLANDFCPVQQFLDNNINVTLGTDGAASNNDLDMFGEMRTAAFIGKNVARDPQAVSATSVLKMATVNGAKALGMQNKIGRLAVGLSADVIAVNLKAINTQPLYHPISQLVYSTNSRQVSDVWVAGKRLLADSQFTSLNEQELFAIAEKWQKKIKDVLHVTA